MVRLRVLLCQLRAKHVCLTSLPALLLIDGYYSNCLSPYRCVSWSMSTDPNGVVVLGPGRYCENSIHPACDIAYIISVGFWGKFNKTVQCRAMPKGQDRGVLSRIEVATRFDPILPRGK